ncbi:hypothetical protein [Paenibacillus sp. WC2504]|uniref:hypothetical protein n=1 Tax=Paenibacillus sp. WC2504 TaxID=3461403 RepID=UPI00404655C4
MKRAGGSTGIQKAAELLSKVAQSVGETVALYEAKQDLNRYQKSTSALTVY